MLERTHSPYYKEIPRCARMSVAAFKAPLIGPRDTPIRSSWVADRSQAPCLVEMDTTELPDPRRGKHASNRTPRDNGSRKDAAQRTRWTEGHTPSEASREGTWKDLNRPKFPCGIKKTSARPLPLHAFFSRSTFFYRSVDGLLSARECAAWINYGEETGFERSFHTQTSEMAHRDNGRITLHGPGVAAAIFARVGPFVPAEMEGR